MKNKATYLLIAHIDSASMSLHEVLDDCFVLRRFLAVLVKGEDNRLGWREAAQRLFFPVQRVLGAPNNMALEHLANIFDPRFHHGAFFRARATPKPECSLCPVGSICTMAVDATGGRQLARVVAVERIGLLTAEV